jgi:hypothetical protein
LEIINLTAGNGAVNLLATGNFGTGDLKIDQASIKARNLVNIECTKLNCDVSVTDSELIATNDLTFDGTGGTLFVTASGDVSITGTTFTGGEVVKFISTNGSITVSCATGGADGCKDPNIQPIPPIVIRDCGNPPVFPCDIKVLNAAELKSICFVVVDAKCDGGSKEKDFIAKGAINIPNLVMTAKNHLVLRSTNGPINAMGAKLDVDGDTVFLVTDGLGVNRIIDLRGATVDSAGNFTIKVVSGCPVSPGISIDGTGATFPGTKPVVSACNGNGLVTPPLSGPPWQ